MELREVKLVFKNIPDFFTDNRLENFIASIPLMQLEKQVSELNKVAAVNFKGNEANFSLVITTQQIHLTFKSLNDLSEAIPIFNAMDATTSPKIVVDFVIFNGVVNTNEGIDSYNSLLDKEPSDSIKVKMLGVEFKSTNFEYRVSFNKHLNHTNINSKSLLQCGINDAIKNTNDSFKEFNVEFQKLSMFI